MCMGLDLVNMAIRGSGQSGQMRPKCGQRSGHTLSIVFHCRRAMRSLCCAISLLYVDRCAGDASANPPPSPDFPPLTRVKKRTNNNMYTVLCDWDEAATHVIGGVGLAVLAF